MNSNESSPKALIARQREADEAFAAEQLMEYRDVIDTFKEFSARKGIRLTDDNFAYFPTIGVVASAPAIINHLTGGLPRERDGVISFDALANTYQSIIHQPGYFRGEHFMLMAHPYFRRGMHGVNNFAPRFVDLLWRFEDDAVVKYVAIDEDRVRVNVDNRFYFEKDTWYGPPFNEDIPKIPSGTTKLRPPMDLKPEHVSFFFANAYCLDIKWSQEGRIKTFQALEFKSEQSCLMLNGQKFFPARYLHAEFDLDIGAFRHFDGAVQCYTEQEYTQRRDSDFNYNAKSQAQIKARSKKLFKFNGRLGTERWIEFSSHFFTGNPLVFEYFTGKYPEHVQQAITRLRDRYVPQDDA